MTADARLQRRTLDATAEPPLRSSSKRNLLALYLDFVLFSAIFTPAAWLIKRAGGPEIAPMMSYVLFGLVWIGFLRALGVSPGRWAIGISRGPEAVVDGSILDRETWWTMLAGTLLVLEGSKNLVRWTQGLPPPPLLGEAGPEAAAFATVCVIGLANVAAGIQTLRTNPLGAFVGAGIVALESAATILNRQAFRDWAEGSVTARRALQGIPVRHGEVEFMQDVASMYLPIGLALGVVWLVAVAIHFQREEGT
jgi:hypothetical protein